MKRKQADKIAVVCARCGWRGKRSRTSIWPACPRCGARADLILPVEPSIEKDDEAEKEVRIDIQRRMRAHDRKSPEKREQAWGDDYWAPAANARRR
jgi:predicted  nucleic acid-binding Zn-ribbon protein